MTEGEMWESHPAVLFATLDKLHQRERRKDYRAGLIAAVTANVHLDKNKQMQPMDFFEGPKPARPSSPQDISSRLRAWGRACSAAKRHG